MEIEPRIKGLVAILRKVPFIQTTASCEGHFFPGDVDYSPTKDKAYVTFEIEKKDEMKLLDFIDYVLKRNPSGDRSVNLEFTRRYYRLVGENEQFINNRIVIIPHDYLDPEEKRELTDMMIGAAVLTTETYLNEKCDDY